MTTCVDVKDVYKIFKNKNNDGVILNNISLSVEYGKIFTLIGASGCGKTILFTCLMGMQEIQNGEIKIFGQKVSYKKTSKISHLIGYMPQQTALVPQLTIRETFQYFGDIFMMNANQIEERIADVSELLKLPSLDRYIEDLSGGQKRRVSLAVAIFHSPKLLLLDEPTVGLDFELCAKIWVFLKESAASCGTSILITTQYISEARHADKCGFMRNGTLIAQDSPGNILMELNCATLDDAFYILSVKNEKEVGHSMNVETDAEDILAFESVNEEMIENIEEVNQKFRPHVFKALLTKEFIRIKRQPVELFTIFILPLLQINLVFSCIGVMPRDIKIGVINNEFIQHGSCQVAGDKCYTELLSCTFLHGIEDKCQVKNFENVSNAMDELKNRKLNGVFLIPKNFTEIILDRHEDDPDLVIYLNYRDYVTDSYTKFFIFKSFENSFDVLKDQCKSTNEMTAMKFENMFQDMDYDTTKTTGSAAVILLSFGLVSMMSSVAINSARVEGVWNRTLLSGVKISEIVLANIVIAMTISTILLVQQFSSLLWALKFKIPKNSWILMLLIWLSAYLGYNVGFLISIILENFFAINGIGIAIFYSTIILSGMFWPHHAIHWILNPLVFMLPTNRFITSFLDVVSKEYNIKNSSVNFGVLFGLFWIIILSFISKRVLKKFKYSKEL